MGSSSFLFFFHQVIRVNPRFATVKILTVGDKPLRDNPSGIIRVQDVRATEIGNSRRNKWIGAFFRPSYRLSSLSR